MNPTAIFTKINKDKLYLLKLYSVDFLITGLLALIFALSNPLSTLFPKSITQGLVAIPFAIIWGLVLSSLLHNSSHDNIKFSVLNRVVGIFAGAWVLYGLSNFVMIHTLHHKYSDQDLDPVNPMGMSFLVFLSAPMRYMIKTAKKYLFQVHGNKENYTMIMNAQSIIFHANLILKLAMWYLLFGKILFVTFFLVSLLTNYFIFAHINYICHRVDVNGSVEVVNLDHNLYYKIANLFTMGGYYHKNHHLNLRIFNPKNLKSQRAQKPLITVTANT